MSLTNMLGLGLTFIFITNGRNIEQRIVAHVLINLVIEPWLLLSSVSGEWKKIETTNTR
jgi:membrane protease YdiL (CAAX protease family)